MSVKSLEALPIGLDEFDVRPREAFGKLAQGTLDTLGSKVAKEAPIMIEFSAKAGGAGAAPAAPAATGGGAY